MRAHTLAWSRARTHTHTHTYTHTHTRAHQHRACAHGPCTRACIYTHVHAHAHRCIHACASTNTEAFVHKKAHGHCKHVSEPASWQQESKQSSRQASTRSLMCADTADTSIQVHMHAEECCTRGMRAHCHAENGQQKRCRQQARAGKRAQAEDVAPSAGDSKGCPVPPGELRASRAITAYHGSITLQRPP